MKKILFIVLILIFCVQFAGSQQSERVEDFSERRDDRRIVSCLFPLTAGNRWQYNIFQKGKKVGFLQIDVIRDYRADLLSWRGKKVFELRIQDTLRKKRYRRHVLVHAGFLYIYYPDEKKAVPWLKTFLTIGDQVGDLLVTDTSSAVFLNKKLPAVTLKHLNGKIIEKYMYHTGLFYYRKDDMEYRLVSAMVQRYGCFGTDAEVPY